MNPADARKMNARNIFNAIRRGPGASQTDIVRQTGLDKTTVSTVIKQFDAMGVIERRPGTLSARRGRPTESLFLGPAAGLLLGVAIEPRRISFRAATLGGHTVTSFVSRFDGNLASARQRIAEGVRSLLDSVPEGMGAPRAIGVCISGPIDNSGRLRQLPHSFRDLRIVEMLEDSTDLPVFVDNDAKAAALAEHLFGAEAGAGNFIYVNIGTGVGAGLFLDGQVYRGSSGFAGELGHMQIIPNGRQCHCGALGCLSAYIGESSLVARLGALGGSAATLEEIAAETGDPKIAALAEESGAILGGALANVANLLNPSLIVLGGRIRPLLPALMPHLLKAFESTALSALRADCRISISELDGDLSALGAIAVALEGFSASGIAPAPKATDQAPDR